MGNLSKFSRIMAAIFLMLASSVAAQAQNMTGSQYPIVVGRISYLSGQLLRYVPKEKDWVATVKDAPFGLNDALYSGDGDRAEIIIPNGAWVRIGNNTQIQLISLKDDYTEADIATGIARFYNKSDTAMIKATTPFGYVLAPGKTIFDLYVGDESVEVIALKGKVDFIPLSGNEKYIVNAGGPSILADNRQVTSGGGTVDQDWDAFNAERDDIWARRLHEAGDSMRYLPYGLYDEAYVLDEYGQWDHVYYEGAYREFWRPTRVGFGWAPFTYGHWTVWYGDNCWIPDEAFGYVTHHYGNWIYIAPHWYWAPPMAGLGTAVEPGFFIGFGWYPGRVSWIFSDNYVGWVPLAPFEPFYCHHHWGRRCYTVIHFKETNINIRRYSYIHHAVIIHRKNFYGVGSYHFVRITRVKDVYNYKVAAVVNTTVIPNYNKILRRYDFTNVKPIRKPHESIAERIRYNKQVARRSANLTGKEVWQKLDRIREAQPVRGGRVKNSLIGRKRITPKITQRPPQKEFQQRKSIERPPAALGYPSPAMRHEYPQPPIHERREVRPPFVKENPRETHPESPRHHVKEPTWSSNPQKGPQQPLKGSREEGRTSSTREQTHERRSPEKRNLHEQQPPAGQYRNITQPKVQERKRVQPSPSMRENTYEPHPSQPGISPIREPLSNKSLKSHETPVQKLLRVKRPRTRKQPARPSMHQPGVAQPPSSPQNQKMFQQPTSVNRRPQTISPQQGQQSKPQEKEKKRQKNDKDHGPY